MGLLVLSLIVCHTFIFCAISTMYLLNSNDWFFSLFKKSFPKDIVLRYFFYSSLSSSNCTTKLSSFSAFWISYRLLMMSISWGQTEHSSNSIRLVFYWWEANLVLFNVHILTRSVSNHDVWGHFRIIIHCNYSYSIYLAT